VQLDHKLLEGRIEYFMSLDSFFIVSGGCFFEKGSHIVADVGFELIHDQPSKCWDKSTCPHT
jgi:hypothetical protein